MKKKDIWLKESHNVVYISIEQVLLVQYEQLVDGDYSLYEFLLYHHTHTVIHFLLIKYVVMGFLC